MKKLLLAVVFVFTLFCLCACHEDDEYTQLNKVIATDYAETKIEVQTDAGNGTLNSTITVKKQAGKSTVTYRVEKFTEISVGQIPSEYVTVYEGTEEVVNGEVTSQTGDALEGISFADVTGLPFVFKEQYFENAVFDNGVFSAKVFGPGYFTSGRVSGCTDMRVTFDYGGEQKVLTMVYTDANGALVKVVYTLK